MIKRILLLILLMGIVASPSFAADFVDGIEQIVAIEVYNDQEDINIDRYDDTADTTVYVKNSDATYVANLDVEGSVTAAGGMIIGEFVWVADGGSIQITINDITDESSSKPYTVMIPPGVYTEQVTMADYISLDGCGIGSTIVQNEGSNDATIIPADNVTISNMTIIATGTGHGIGNKDIAGLANDTWIVRNVRIEATYDLFFSNQNGVTVYIYDCIGVTGYDGIACLTGASGGNTWYVHNLHVTKSGAGLSTGIFIYNTDTTGKMYVYDSSLFATLTTEADHYGITAGGEVNLYDFDMEISGNLGSGKDITGVWAYGASSDVNLYGGRIAITNSGDGAAADFLHDAGTINVYGTRYSIPVATITGYGIVDNKVKVLVGLDGPSAQVIDDVGISTFHTTTADTDVARGIALAAAITASGTGDTILVGPGAFDMGETTIVQKASQKLKGSGKFTTVITVDGVVGNDYTGIKWADQSSIESLSIVVTSQGYAFSDVNEVGLANTEFVVRDCHIDATFDFIRNEQAGVTAWFYDCTTVGLFDGFFQGGEGSKFHIYDTDIIMNNTANSMTGVFSNYHATSEIHTYNCTVGGNITAGANFFRIVDLVGIGRFHDLSIEFDIDSTGFIRGIAVEDATSDIKMYGGNIAVTNIGAGAAFDLYQTAGTLNLNGTEFSTSTGTITGFGVDDGNLTTIGNITSGDITIFDATPILVFKDSDSLGAASVGFIEWRDSGGGRAGFFGNSSSGNDDLLWKNEQGGNIDITTTGAGKVRITTNALNMSSNQINNLANPTELSDAVNLDTLLDNIGVSLLYWLSNQTLELILTDSEAALPETPNETPDELTNIFFLSSVIDTPTPFLIKSGTIIAVHFDADETSGAGRNEGLTLQLGYVNSNGTSDFVQIGTDSDSTGELTVTKTAYTQHIHVASDITVPVGKRLRLKVIATTLSGAGGYPELNVYYDNSTHHISIPVAGSILGNVVLKTDPKKITAIVTAGDWDLDSDKFLVDLEGTKYPDGIVITKWSVDCNVADPAVELNANLMFCDALGSGAFPGSGATLIDVLDTTTGNSSENDMSNSDKGDGIIPTTKIIYLDIDVDPATATDFFIVQIHY